MKISEMFDLRDAIAVVILAAMMGGCINPQIHLHFDEKHYNNVESKHDLANGQTDIPPGDTPGGGGPDVPAGPVFP